jgi:DNA modification methylase
MDPEQVNDKKELQTTTVWSFPNRGKWLTHNAKYRGNWAPQVPNNIIQLYSKEGEIVLDPMVGSGTTMIEAKSLGRKGIAFDIHPEIAELAQKNCVFELDKNYYEPTINCGDARHLDTIEDNSVDLISTHPPYLNIIKYGDSRIVGGLSSISSINKFCDEIEKVAYECYRVLKHGKYCALLIGDTRRRRHYIPLAFSVMQRFLKVGFILKEGVIKIQHNCSTTRYWNSQINDCLLIMHEHLFVFRKIGSSENKAIFKDSFFKT